MKRAPGLAGRDPSEGRGGCGRSDSGLCGDVPCSAGEAGGPRRSLFMVVPYMEGRNSGGKVTRKKVRFTVADL